MKLIITQNVLSGIEKSYTFLKAIIKADKMYVNKYVGTFVSNHTNI